MATGVGSRLTSEPPIIPVKRSRKVSAADYHRPVINPPSSFYWDTNLLIWWRKVDLYLERTPTDHQGSYILSWLSDTVQEVLWVPDLSTTATATSIRSWLDEFYLVLGDRVESRTTFLSRGQLIEETAESYTN
ncbi:hypothetical protein AHF37_02542 [Paragonimus kellicotti]|nr:hypothetical protein AHF37_02542 [Paragonimus kellicotti]